MFSTDTLISSPTCKWLVMVRHHPGRKKVTIDETTNPRLTATASR